MSKLDEVSYEVSEVGELGYVSFGMSMLGEEGKVNFGMSKLGEMSFGLLRWSMGNDIWISAPKIKLWFESFTFKSAAILRISGISRGGSAVVRKNRWTMSAP